MAATEEELLARLERRDTTLWPDDGRPVDRFGWLDAPRLIDRQSRDLRKWAESIDGEVVIVLSSGGSALAALALESAARLAGDPTERTLIICDTTDPSTLEALPFEDAFIVVASKSGRSLETSAQFAYAQTRQKNERRYTVITDPRSALLPQAHAFRPNRVFECPVVLGTRATALSYFGMVPAALVGYDLEELCGRTMEVDRLAAVTAGVEMARAVGEGRNKATIVGPDHDRGFGIWAEHLLAGLGGENGLVPVPTTADEPGLDRFAVPFATEFPLALGAAFFEFELRAAVAGHLLGIDPFNSPDVEMANPRTHALLAELPLPELAACSTDALGPFLDEEVRPGDYLAISAYLPYGSEERLEQVRGRLRDNHDGMAVTASYTPRAHYALSSLHTDGPPSVIVIQLVPHTPLPELAVPGTPFTFGDTLLARAHAERAALSDAGRRHITIALDDPGDLL